MPRRALSGSGRARFYARLAFRHSFEGTRYALRVDSDEAVVLTVVASGPEADVVCGLLRSAGIECDYRDTDAIESSLEDFTAAGPREILVHPSDLDAARALLPEAAAG
jgi:putative signal transducing protein